MKSKQRKSNDLFESVYQEFTLLIYVLSRRNLRKPKRDIFSYYLSLICYNLLLTCFYLFLTNYLLLLITYLLAVVVIEKVVALVVEKLF